MEEREFMKKRLLELRKYLKLSQKEFSARMSMPQQTYAAFEVNREIRDNYVRLICQTYNVNEDWLRTGKGDMFIIKPNRELEEILTIYDNLQPTLKKYLLQQAKNLHDLQGKLSSTDEI